MGNDAVCPQHGPFKPTQEGCCPKCWAEHDWSKPNDGITRSGSFGPAAELAAAHTEIERLKAWSNEQIAKLTAENERLRAEVDHWAAEASSFDGQRMAAESRVAELTAENARLRTAPEMAGHTWCKLDRALAAESRLATAVGLIDAYMADDDYDAQGCINRVRAALASAQPAAPADDEWKELDPER